mmetsp:Transcript_25190/g.44921  ORF Transcript_25190/g.44921 Transcript_25190/m.44921 type:complete len:168 (-) Transcript_25190:1536-2039(-)
MRALPQQVHFRLAHAQCTALHGSASSISEFVFYSTAEEKKEREGMLCGAAADVVVGGHCGLPFSQLLGSGLLWHNAGVVGMPANDGTPRTWFSVLQPEEEALRVTHHPLTYNHEAAAKKMRECSDAALLLILQPSSSSSPASSTPLSVLLAQSTQRSLKSTFTLLHG